jgi:SAM-dependent methyltransferase
MKPVPAMRDAYGQQMWAFLKGRGSPVEIVERDDGFMSVAGSNASYFADVRHWSTPERKAIRFARGRTALDVGCGAGRVALHLQENGFQVTAIDNSPLAVKTAKTRGVKRARLLPFEHVGGLPTATFDTVVMFGNNFGLFASRARARRLLKQLHRITREGAVLLAQSLDPYKTNERAHLMYQRRNRRRGRMAGQIRIRIRFNQWVGAWFDYLFVSPAEMSALVDGTGWEVDRFFADDNADPRYVAVIQRVRSER